MIILLTASKNLAPPFYLAIHKLNTKPGSGPLEVHRVSVNSTGYIYVSTLVSNK